MRTVPNGSDDRTLQRVYLDAFHEDAARWVRPEEIAPVSEVTPLAILALLWKYPPLRAMAWFRFAAWTKARGVPVVPGMMQRRIARRYGLELSVGAHIAGGLYVPHPYGTTISAERIGRNVTIIGSVTIGMRGGPERPRIGDGVFIGAGARVLGDIEVGAGASVGANAVVVKSVPPHNTVVGVPARSLSPGAPGHRPPAEQLSSNGQADG